MADSTSQALEKQGIEPWMVEAFGGLSRNEVRSLDSYLSTVSKEVRVEGTEASCHCHFIRREGNERPVADRLAKKVALQAVEYCIPRTRLEEAREHLNRTGSPEKLMRLQHEARKLFTDVDTSGEGGEMLLYLLLEIELGLPQILCKMPKKTNSRVHYHGVDGVHASLEANGKLGLYWCESKLHKDVARAIRECFKSLAPFLLDNGSGSSERDLLLVRDNLDTGDPKLTEVLKRYLDDDAIESTYRVIKGACLVGFSLEDYPNPFEEDGVSVVEEVAGQVANWFKSTTARIKHHKLDKFEIEVFCIPMPSVEEFRKAVKQHLPVS